MSARAWMVTLVGLLALAALVPLARAGTISTVAGEYGLARPAGELGITPAAAIAHGGRLYVADAANDVVWEVDPTGTARRLAGTGDRCEAPAAPCGDGGAAASAQLRAPQALALDAAGNLFVADQTDRIRRIAATAGRPQAGSTITTVAGTGEAGSTGDGGPARDARVSARALGFDGAGNLYFAEPSARIVRRVDAGGDGLVSSADAVRLIAGSRLQCVPQPVTDVDADCGFAGGPATAADLGAPVALAVSSDGAELYIADRDLRLVLRVTDPGGEESSIERVAGTGAACASDCGDGGPATTASFGAEGPAGVALLPGGTLAVSDTGRDRLRAIADGTISNLAGSGAACGPGEACGDGGPPGAAQLEAPGQLAPRADGALLVADGSRRVRLVEPQAVSSAVGTGFGLGCQPFAPCGDGGSAPAARLHAVSALAADGAGNLYLADNGGTRLRRVAADGSVTTVAGGALPCAAPATACGDGGPASAATFGGISDLVAGADGTLYVADAGAHRVRRIVAAGGEGAGADSRIENVAGTGTACLGPQACGDGGAAGAAALAAPSALALNAVGDLYVLEAGRIRRVLAGPAGAAADSPIRMVAGAGEPCAQGAPCGDGGPAGSAQTSSPEDLAITAVGDLVFADESGRRLRRVSSRNARVDATDTVSTLNGAPGACLQSSDPCGDGGALREASFAGELATRLAADAAGGVYVLEEAAHRIRRVLPGAGTVRPDSPVLRWAGSGVACTLSPLAPCGDGVLATHARLHGPTALGVSADFAVLVAERNRVRRVEPYRPPQVGLTSAPAGPAPLKVNLRLHVAAGEGGPVRFWRLAFGDGAPDATGVGAPPETVTHTYTRPGMYTVRLSVADELSPTAEATARVVALDHTAPVVRGFRASPSRFRVARAAAKAATPAGTRFRFTSSELGSARLRFERRIGGSRRARLRFEGSIRRPVVAGSNAIAFSGRIADRPLLAGTYRVTLVVTDRSGNRSRALRTVIRVAAPRPTVRIAPRSLSALLRSGVIVASVRCSDPCRLTAKARRGRYLIGKASGRIRRSGRSVGLRMRLSAAALALMRRDPGRVVVSVRATDTAGNGTTVRRAVRYR